MTVNYTKDLKARGFEAPVRGRVTMKASPLALVIEGVDTPVDTANGLYDERAVKASQKIAPYYDESLVEAMKAGDVTDPKDPITCTVRGGILKVKDGRRRTIHARLAGVSEVEFLIDDDAALDDKGLFLAARKANARRVNDSAIQQARNCMRARKEWGCTVAEFAAAEGLSEAVMRQRLSLLRLSPRLQGLVDSGELDFSVGIQLGKIELNEKDETKRHAAQEAVYDKLHAAGNLTTAAVRREKAAMNGGDETADGGDETADGGGDETADGGGDETAPKGKGDKAAKLTNAEMRRVCLAWDNDDAAVKDIPESTINVLKAACGMMGAGRVAGMTAAFRFVRGE